MEKELDRALGEKQKLQMEVEEQQAAAEEFERRETKMRLEAQQRLEEIKVRILSYTLQLGSRVPVIFKGPSKNFAIC